jgi:glycosyltransferase involved in cell wall biosynthesis
MLEKKRIIIYLSSIPTDGGKFQYALSILSAVEKFSTKKYEIIVVYNNIIWQKIIPKFIKSVQLRNNNVIIKLLRYLVFLILPEIGRDIWRIIGRFIDLNHRTFFSLTPDLIIYAGKDPFIHELSLPGVIPVFDLMHRYEKFPELQDDASAYGRDIYYQRVCKYAKGILVDSNVGLNHVIDNYDVEIEKIFVFPYIAPNYVNEYSVNSEKLLFKFNLPPDYIFYPAQFWSHKNHNLLIEAIYKLKEEKLIVNCVLVGSPKNVFNEIKEKVIFLGLERQIYFLKYVTNGELVALYKTSKALVMPTFLGPTNIPPLEAFALGCPVITSDIYGVKEQVGDAAVLVDPKNVKEIAGGIKSIYTDAKFRERLIRNGYAINKLNRPEIFEKRLNDIIDVLLKDFY